MPRIFPSSRSKTWSRGNTTRLSNVKDSSGWDKFRLLLWKNYKIQMRHNVQTFLEIFLPLLFTIVLVIVRDVVKSERVEKPTIFDTVDLTVKPFVITYACKDLYYTPSTPIIDELMEKVRQDFFVFPGTEYNFTGFSDEKILTKTYDAVAQTSNLQNFTDLEATVSILAGVMFEDPDAYNGDSFPPNIKYTLRFPAQQRSQFDLISERFGIKPAWFTEIAFPLFQYLGPRARDSPVGGLPGYFAEGFLYLQYAIDTTLTKLLIEKSGNETNLKEYENYVLRLQRFPYKPYIEDKYLFALQAWLPMLTVLSFIYPVLNTTKAIVYEKEKRLKESMKMMGLPNYLHWAAWFTKAFSFLLLSILLMTFLITTKFSAKQDLAILSYVNPAVLFTIFLAFMIQLIAFCFMISAFASSANFAATLAGVLWFIFFAPYFFLQPRYNILSRNVKLLSCYLTNAPIALACQILCMFEGTGAGLQWSTFFKGSGPDDNFSMGDCVVMMLVNALMYLLITVYVEAVWPGEFGVPLPWNFPFKKWYWVGGIRDPSDGGDMFNERPKVPLEVKSQLFEAEPGGVAGIQIKGLTKDFHTGKLAVNGLTLNMYQNQITALLGHNGAGKTTTMSMLTGLFPPTSGTALINNYDICTDIQMVRSSLGICPQHDVLFDDLTVEEHLKFFCLLKGFPKELVPTEIDRMVNALGLADKRKAQAHTLSGGMKRKLSVGIALCAGSKVVLLDEPTSGMDPSARRSTWDLIQNEKKGRTVLLSTHFMEEADLLGDRIAIMAEGELQCCGSSLFLKKKYGGGYHLIIVKDDSCVVENITNLLKKRIPDVEIDQDIGAELSYSLPDEKSHLFPEMFEELESRKTELGIASYGASITTMEEVFIRVGREAEKKITEEYLKSNPGATAAEIQALGGAPVSANGKSVTSVQINMDGSGASTPVDSTANLYTTIKRRNSGTALTLQQLRAMLTKKAIYAVRNRMLLLGQMGIPFLYLTIVLIVMKTLPGLVDPPGHFLTLERYEMIGKTVTTVHCENNSAICQNYKAHVRENFAVNEVKGNQSFIEHMLEREEEDLVLVNFRYIVGYEERPSTEVPGKQELVGFFNNQPFHSPALAFNYLTNAILRTFTKHTVGITNHPFPYTSLDGLKSTGSLYTMGFQIGYNLTFGMSFVAASFVVFLIQERESRSKHLQFVSGLKFFIFWIANYVIDILCYMIACVPVVLVILIFQIDDFMSFEMMSYFIILLMAYGASTIPFMYLFSYAFTIPASGFTRVAMYNVFTGMASMLTVVILQIPDLRLGKVADFMNDVLLIFPNYAVGMGTVQLSTNLLLNKQCAHEFKFLADICEIHVENYCCTKVQQNFFAWKLSGIGKNIAALLTIGVISSVMLLLFDSKVLKHLKLKSKQTVKDDEDETKIEQLAVDDNDVTEENERIRKTNLDTLFQSNNLILRDLTKYYGSFLAVNKLNLGVKRGQTFGLLGINGAGKTTSFKMLTGDIPISSGDAFVASHSVRHDIKSVHNNLGYCPQFDGIIGEMTGRETLVMIARLRGIYEEDIPAVTNKLANDLIFTKHLDKLVKNYSGGNKRKLSTAMALVGNPPIVFLDEPTTGMDPVARRHLWNAISIVRDSGTSVVLTSHSMEECEALCSRLAIMVNGKFRCLGSPQHLKNKFGEGYTLIAQTAPTGLGEDFSRAKLESGRRRSSSIMLKKLQVAQKWETDLDGLRNFIEEAFPDAVLKDIHPGFVHYHISPSPNISWGRMFRQMEIAKDKFNLDAYSVGQTSLEQVFLNFAKAQVDIDEPVRRRNIIGLVKRALPILKGD